MHDKIKKYFDGKSINTDMVPVGKYYTYMITTNYGVKYTVFTGKNLGLTSFSLIVMGGGTVAHLIPILGEELRRYGLAGCRIKIDDDGDMMFEYEIPIDTYEDLVIQDYVFDNAITKLTDKNTGKFPMDW